MKRAQLAVAGCTALLAIIAAGCGSSSDDKATATTEPGGTATAAPTAEDKGFADTYTVGTTDKIVSLDPAGSYDLGSQQLIGNIYQNLLAVPAGGSKPEFDAAESCEFTDPKTYSCTLKDGLTFSSGDPLTSEDVKFSLDRQIKIADPSGASSLLASLKDVTTPDPKTVVMNLKKADGTWPYILTHTVAAIVPSKIFPADKKQPDDKVVGSGPYKLDKYTAGQQAVFSLNENYNGPNKGLTANVLMQYYDQPSALKLAIEQGEVDVAYRSLLPTDIEALRADSGSGVKVVDGAGTEIHYIVFNVDQAPTDKLAVRQAIATVIDRQALVDTVYKGTAAPLYSSLPAAFPGHKDSFKDKYGDPDPAKAKQILEDAGVKIPLSLDAWYTPTHYVAETDDWNEIKRQLEASGLFKVKLDSTEWTQYKDAAFAKHQYYMYGLGWFPDYPDGDNYLAPFMRDGGFFQNGYKNPKVNDLLDQELASSDDAERTDIFGQLQDIQAEDIPILPLWEGKQVAAIREGIEGVEKTFDPAFQFRFWLVTKKNQ